MKILPMQVQLESAGQTQKTVTVNLLGDQSLDALVGSPGAWRQVQSDRTVSLHRGDQVNVWSSDGLVFAEGLLCIRSLAGEVWLSKPLRIVSMEVEALWEDKTHRIISRGNGFVISHKRTEAVEDKIYQSVSAAQAVINRRAPTH